MLNRKASHAAKPRSPAHFCAVAGINRSNNSSSRFILIGVVTVAWRSSVWRGRSIRYAVGLRATRPVPAAWPHRCRIR